MITGTCMNLSLGLFRKGYNMPGLEPDLRWAWLTLTLSLLVAVGYVAIAFNWYFQNKVAGRHATRAAVRRLSSIVLCCAAFGLWFFVTDMSWPAWRVYEVPISYSGRTYAEGKKIRWTDGVAALWHIIKFNLLSQKAPRYQSVKPSVTQSRIA